MLKNVFFTIASLNIQNNAIEATLQLNAKHAIFSGHFPGRPIVPGACMLQMVREIIQTAIAKQIQLTKAFDIKFLIPLNPAENNILQMTIKFSEDGNGIITAIANILHGSSICFKFNGVFKPTL